MTEVRVLWNKLKCEARELYGNHFMFLGDRCLFSLCLDKQKSINQNLLCDNPKPHEEMILKGNKITKLFNIFKNLNGPITKEELFHLVWGVPAQDKEDLAKLSHAVSRLHKEFGIRLKSKRGCYCLDQDKEAA